MLFQPDHIVKIENGKKTVTRRLWKRWHVKIGGTYPAQKYMYQPRAECPLIHCEDRYLQPLGDMTEEDADKEGGYTLEEYRNLWEEINGVPFLNRQVVYVIEFQYAGPGSEGVGGSLKKSKLSNDLKARKINKQTELLDFPAHDPN